jgi:hypothetical protein
MRDASHIDDISNVGTLHTLSWLTTIPVVTAGKMDPHLLIKWAIGTFD